jgi:molybdenum cofactor biosynthesis enzyme
MPHHVDSRTNLPGTTIAILQSHLLGLCDAPEVEMDIPQGASVACLTLWDMSTGALLATAPSRVVALLQVTTKG